MSISLVLFPQVVKVTKSTLFFHFLFHFSFCFFVRFCFFSANMCSFYFLPPFPFFPGCADHPRSLSSAHHGHAPPEQLARALGNAQLSATGHLRIGIYIYICLSKHLSFDISIQLSAYLSIHLSIFVDMHELWAMLNFLLPDIFASVFIFTCVYLNIYLSIYLSSCLHIYLSIYLSL